MDCMWSFLNLLNVSVVKCFRLLKSMFKYLLVFFSIHLLHGEDTCMSSNNVRDCNDHSVRTFIAIKPDAVQRGLIGEITGRFEKKGFKLIALKFMKASQDLLKLHYAEHKDRTFFLDLIEYMNSGPVVAMVWEGKGVVKGGRSLLGATNPIEATPGTIRGDLAMETGRNLCHASDSIESAEREINLWFEKDLVHWKADLGHWIHE